MGRGRQRVSGLAFELRSLMHQRGFSSCDDDAAIARFHTRAQSLIPGTVASLEVMAAVQGRGRSCLYLRKADDADDAFLAIFAFSKAGERAVQSNVFSALDIRPAWIEPPSLSTRLGYVWGFGASTVGGKMAVLRALRAMRESLFGHVALMARAASGEGAALMAPFGLQPQGERFYAPAPALERAP